MRLDHDPSFGHLGFVRLQNLAQISHLLAHLLEYFVDGIHSHIAAFESLKRVADRQLFRGSHQKWLCSFRVRSCAG